MNYKILFLGLCLLSLTSCAARHRKTAAHGNMNTYHKSSNVKTVKAEERMMVYNAYVSIAAKNQDSVSSQVAQVAKSFNGYVISSSNNSTTIKVESTVLKEALKAIETLGKVKSKSINGSDMTDAFTDNTIRLENSEKTRKRYLELLDKAVTVEEILKIEKELERLNVEIDVLKGRINKINHNVEYSTIDITHTKKVKYGPLGYVFHGAYQAFKWLFVRQ